MEPDLKKKLILVNPSVGNFAIRYSIVLFLSKNIPAALLTLAALTPRDYKIKFVNQFPFFFRKNLFKGSLVCITSMTASVMQAYKLAVAFRKAGAYVVLGGPHVTALPQEAIQYANSVVVGEAESVWKEVILDFENKSLKKIYRGEYLDDFFSPSYDYFLNLDTGILRRTVIPISRGCKYNCDFCARLPGPVRYTKIEQIVEIVKRMKGGKIFSLIHRFFPLTINFADSNIFSNPEYAKKLFKELIPLKIKWGSQSSIDIAFDEEALTLARKSGCRGLLIGFETIHPEGFKKTSVHNMTSLEDYVTSINKIRSHGIQVTGCFIAGFDQYTHLDYFKLLYFLMSSLIKCRMYWITLTILTPFPGSQLFDRLKREARITTYDWNKYDIFFHVVFKPKIKAISLILWYSCIRIITLFCSELLIFVFIVVLASYYISHYLKVLFFIHRSI